MAEPIKNTATPQAPNGKTPTSLVPQKERFSVAIRTDAFQTLINSTLGDPKRALNFTASILSVVATNPALQECDHKTVLNAALLGETLSLPPSPQLGYFYMVPFEERKQNEVTKEWETARIVATFVLGWKGYVQLAIRSGQYRKINVLEIKKGELGLWNPWTEELQIRFIGDEAERAKAETVGYVAGFELVNGFQKVLYWSKPKMLEHADRYSKAFKASNYALLVAGKVNPNDRKYSSFWYKDFDGMAMKTMIRQLLGKWGIMSVEMQKAFENDTAYTDDMGNRIYPDSPESPTELVENVKDAAKASTASTPIPPKAETKNGGISDEEAARRMEADGQQSLPIEEAPGF